MFSAGHGSAELTSATRVHQIPDMHAYACAESSQYA